MLPASPFGGVLSRGRHLLGHFPATGSIDNVGCSDAGRYAVPHRSESGLGDSDSDSPDPAVLVASSSRVDITNGNVNTGRPSCKNGNRAGVKGGGNTGPQNKHA